MNYPEKTLDQQDVTEIKNYTRIPNMLIFGYLDTISPQEKWLYVCLKHMCGKKGTRHLSLRYISEQTGISTGALSTSKNKKGEINLGMIRHLHDAGLIHSEIKKPGGKGNPQYHITITDVWALNQAFFSKTCSEFGQDEEEDAEPVRNSDEPVQNSDKLVRNSDEPVRNSANTNIRDKTINKTRVQDESISAVADSAPAFSSQKDHFTDVSKEIASPPTAIGEPAPDMKWGTRKCLQWFDFWRGGTLIGKYKLMQASTCAKGLAEQFTEEQVIKTRMLMMDDPFWIAQGSVDVCHVANNIHKYLNRSQQSKANGTKPRPTVLVSEEQSKKNKARMYEIVAAKQAAAQAKKVVGG